MVAQNTIDNRDLSHFNTLWKNDNWGTSSEMQVLMKMNAVRVPFILKVAEETGLTRKNTRAEKISPMKKPLQGLKILDAGCGAGFLSEVLAQLGADVVGIDVAEEAIRLAEEHLQKNKEVDSNKITYLCDRIEDYCVHNRNKFDMIVSSEVVDHVGNPSLFIKSCVETLKPGCPIVISTINRTWSSWLKVIIFFEYVTGIIPKGTHHYNKFITPEELQDMLLHCNCETRSLQGCDYDYLKGKWTNTQHSANFYKVYAVKNK